MKTIAIAVTLVIVSFPAMSQEATDDPAFAEVQKRFAESYNRKDVDAMAAAFSENAVRVTPSGIFRGRDAIRQKFSGRFESGATRLFRAADRQPLVRWPRLQHR